METLIEAHNLHKSFGDTIAVDNINLSIAAGEIYGLLGPDGAGKTTTLRLLCGSLQPARAKGSEHEYQPVIKIAGYDILQQTEPARAQIGYLPQRFSLYEEMTVLENLRFFAEVRGLSAAEWHPRSIQILEFVGLQEFIDRRAGHLSGGMKQKLGLAAALVHNPHVLLLDEPTTGVDPVTRQDFWQLIIRLVAANHDTDQCPAVLISTPYMDEAARCTRVGFMQQGKIRLEGKPSRLQAALNDRILELSGHPLPALRSLVNSDSDVEDVQMFGDRLHIRVRQGTIEQVVERLHNQIHTLDAQITRLRPIAPQLEDVFIDLVSNVDQT
ncbi:MAG: ABC transporter ATP-binding protein [Chloroflexota bacterium]|nr:ABC transporter ATP-binding protein [Chloroflexota bacterium]